MWLFRHQPVTIIVCGTLAAIINKIKAEADHSDRPETIGVEQPGKYDIDLKGLLEKEPIVIQKDGTYTIHLPSLFKMREEKKK